MNSHMKAELSCPGSSVFSPQFLWHRQIIKVAAPRTASRQAFSSSSSCHFRHDGGSKAFTAVPTPWRLRVLPWVALCTGHCGSNGPASLSLLTCSICRLHPTDCPCSFLTGNLFAVYGSLIPSYCSGSNSACSSVLTSPCC